MSVESPIDRAWIPRASVLLRAAASVIALASALALWGCGSDNGSDPIDEGSSDLPSRTSPEELMDYFAKAYSERDSSACAAMLHESYSFYFLPEDADSLSEPFPGWDDYWGRTRELMSAGRLFRRTDVTGVALSIVISTNSPSNDEACPTCRQLEAHITLRVETVGEGTEPLILSVDSQQTFFVRPDQSDETKWLLWKQIDRRSNPGVEGRSWGGIKRHFDNSET